MKPAVPRSQRPAIWADAMRLAVEIEQAVRGFSRYHKYTLGVDLRRRVLRQLRWPAAPPGQAAHPLSIDFDA